MNTKIKWLRLTFLAVGTAVGWYLALLVCRTSQIEITQLLYWELFAIWTASGVTAFYTLINKEQGKLNVFFVVLVGALAPIVVFVCIVAWFVDNVLSKLNI